MEEFTRLLDAGCEEWERLTEKQKEQFFKYFQLLTEWKPGDESDGHYRNAGGGHKAFCGQSPGGKGVRWDPYRGVFLYRRGDRSRIFPESPLKIAFPQLQIMLLDSLNKRVGFLNTVIQELGLTGITAVHGRAEDFGRNKEYREQFDLCVSRAVANLSTLSEYCLPFVKAGGEFLPYKSGKVEEEAREAESAVKKLGGSMRETKTLVLPGTDVDRTFVPIDKINVTPKKYPRKAGMPGKEPLK